MIVRFLVALLSVLLAAFVGVMFSDCAAENIGGYLGLIKKADASVPKNEILKFLGIGMGGVLLAIQAVMSYMRAKAMEDAANAQAGATEQQAKANENAERGLRQERLKNAIEHLGHRSDSVRLGGAYELFHLAQDTETLRQTVLDILCAHIRRTTGEAEYRVKHRSKPSEEIQSLLTLLFVQEHEVFKGLHINLQGSWLNGAKLENARLEKANLLGVYLQKARLKGAHLQEADLLGAYLQSANLTETHMQGVDIWGAHLQGASLVKAYLQGTNIWGAQLQGANILDAQFQGSDLSGAQLQGVASNTPEPFLGLVKRIRGAIGRQSDLSGVIFEGGLNQEDVNSLVEGLSYEDAKVLREKLTPHIDKPTSHELPENSGAVTGAYTQEEAEEWIAEYEKAMSKVQKKETDTGDV